MIVFLGVVSIVSLLIAAILLLNLIQRAFDREGVVWGLLAVVYPPGTYLFCRRNWQEYRPTFIKISALVVVSIVLGVIVKLTG